jgi:hypothetical protein
MDLSSVRRQADYHGWEEVQFNAASRVIGFKRGDDRVNVYYTTGAPAAGAGGGGVGAVPRLPRRPAAGRQRPTPPEWCNAAEAALPAPAQP